MARACSPLSIAALFLLLMCIRSHEFLHSRTSHVVNLDAEDAAGLADESGSDYNFGDNEGTEGDDGDDDEGEAEENDPDDTQLGGKITKSHGRHEIEVVAEDGSELAAKMQSVLASLMHAVSKHADIVDEDASSEEPQVGTVDSVDSDDIDGDAAEDETTENAVESDLGPGENAAETVVPENHNIRIAAEVGNHKVKMLVDTGGSISVISGKLAKHLGLLSHMDRSTEGSIEGVGEARVLGSLTNVPVKMGNRTFPLNFFVATIAEPLLLLGVDQLRQLKCVVDMDRNCLVVGGQSGVKIPFLPYRPAYHVSESAELPVLS